jgi:hypothetical protein
MNGAIDHIIWACRDLESGIDTIESMTGVRAEIGGRHPGLGTHNALMHIGNRSYFEIVAPDPDQDGGPWARSLQAMPEPGLLHWVIARPDLGEYQNGLPGLVSGGNRIMRVSRLHPKLGQLNWELMLIPGHEHGCLVPFLIDWGDSTHPTESIEAVCTLTRVRITTPRLDEIRKISTWLGIEAEFSEGDESKLEFCIDAPKGEITFATSQPVPLGVSFTS